MSKNKLCDPNHTKVNKKQIFKIWHFKCFSERKFQLNLEFKVIYDFEYKNLSDSLTINDKICKRYIILGLCSEYKTI